MPVFVKGFVGVRESLQSMIDGETLEGENRYSCDACGCKSDARKTQCLRELPPILNFSLQRFEYDWMRDDRVKITDDFAYPLTINMSPYLESTLMKGGDGRDDQEHIYDLYSVVIHNGSAHAGHYHAYIRDTTGEGNWNFHKDGEVSSSAEASSSSAAASSSSTSTADGATAPRSTTTRDTGVGPDDTGIEMHDLTTGSSAPRSSPSAEVQGEGSSSAGAWGSRLSVGC